MAEIYKTLLPACGWGTHKKEGLNDEKTDQLVADPEKPGRTRDDWHLVVNVMHGYGLHMTPDEADMIVDLLYGLRKGMEREAG